MLDELLVIVALVLANGVLAGAEIAVIAVRGARADELSRSRPSDRALRQLRANPERFFATVQIGITVISAAAAAYGGSSFAAHLVPTLRSLPVVGPRADAVALALAVTLVSYLSLVLGELVPKSLALRYAERYSLTLARPLLWISFLARPLVWFLTASSNALLRIFGDRTTFVEARLSGDELQRLMDEAARSGSVHPEASEIASRAIDMADLTATHVMIPRMDVVAIPRRITQDELRRTLREKSRARMPVYDEDLDHIVGYVTLHELFEALLERGEIAVDAVMRPAHFVPESMRAVDLLAEMRERRSELAVAVDEQGSLSGIVTMENLLEELIGDYALEREGEPEEIRAEPDGALVVLGHVPVRDLNRELDLGLPEGPGFSTIAGLCLDLAGRIPEVGAALAAPDGTILEIVEASTKQVHAVRLRRPPRPTNDGESDASR